MRTRLVLFLTLLLILPAFAAPASSAIATTPSLPTADETGNYVIIIPDSSFETAVAPLKTWKQLFGYTVRVVTLDTIYGLYTGDNAERIWQFLHDRYPPDVWGIRYVLLVGDVDRMPIRMLYPDGNAGDGSAYASDFYYANLSMANWDVDGDNRWGEFTHDHLDQDFHAEVIVGRIPLSDPRLVQDVSNHIVAFEKDIGGWKRNVLLAHGIMDYGDAVDPAIADIATLAERLKQDYFTPFGWTPTTLYEKGGISPSPLAASQPLSQTTFENNCGVNGQAVINVAAHGNQSGNEMDSLVWVQDFNGNGVAEDGPVSELTWNGYSQQGAIATHPTTGIAFLLGCNTGLIVGDDPDFAKSKLGSRYIITATRGALMLKEYLQSGAPAVIASTAGSDYDDDWIGPNDPEGYGQSLNYYFYRHLIEQDMKAGDAFFAAQEQYVVEHQLQRGIRVFNYFGDPSLIMKGVEERPGGVNTLVKEGTYFAIAADYAENGDMYVAVVSTAPDATPARIDIFRSTDHGEHWTGWTSVEEPNSPISDVATLVSTYTGEDIYSDALHVFYTTGSGRVMDVRIDRADPDFRRTNQVADEPRWAVNISAARDPVVMPGNFYLYVAWAFTALDGSKQVQVYQSRDNGLTWAPSYYAANASMPHVQAGPGDRVHLAVISDDGQQNVLTVRSTDRGMSWEPLKYNLTAGDSALTHATPVVATSNDPAFPAIWVAYVYASQDLTWGNERDLYFAYSKDGGVTWEVNHKLSSDRGVDEWAPDMTGIRGAPNRWVNLAYNYDNRSAGQYQRRVIWRYTSGGLPVYWTAQRIVNDFNGAAPYPDAPVVVYSPGASVAGSGVVYGGLGRTNIYFAAPWIPSTLPANAVADAADVQADVCSQQPQTIAPGLLNMAAVDPSSQPLVWLRTGDLPGASTVTSIQQINDGTLYAAAVVGVDATRNEGRVFRSANAGQSWEALGPLDDCWSLTSVLQTTQGALLAGGMARTGSEISGAVYRSPDGGNTWNRVLTFPDGAVYGLVALPDGTVWATTGWLGKLFKSGDDGRTWSPAGEIGAQTTLHDLMQAGSGVLYLATEGASTGQILRSEDQGASWTPAAGLDGVAAVYDLLEANGALFAAVRAGAQGRVYRSTDGGLSWTASGELPSAGVYAVYALQTGRDGRIFAGTAAPTGQLTSQVFASWNSGAQWQRVGGVLDAASAVYTLAIDGDVLYAGTGTYAGVHKVSVQAHTLYLPSMRR